MNKALLGRTLMLSVLVISSWLMACSPANKSETQDSDTSSLLLHVPSPEWQDQIIYFLMTDRFADGNPDNNDQGAGVYDPTQESHYSGGDIQGVIDNLDYIQNLGATAVWTTPIVANQWWSEAGNYGGYHGYWATDFSEVDAHVGSLDTYQQLSDALHRRDMYLIQDIVVNHTGNFFNYEGGIDGYDPDNTARNFVLLESGNSKQPAPVQSPFDKIDRNNPAHVQADIYNWTPSISDYADEAQQFTYQLATLADINTTNPVVLDVFKDIYSDWIKNVGIDAFRIDTVRYVEHEFFHHFMHDSDGIHAAAKATGRDAFLAFGEVFDTSKPYKNDAEQRVASYLGTSSKPELNSVISFPLHHELKTVFAQGFPTDHLAYRIQQHMTVYDNPYVIPTFIDNHDMGRFLASGNIAGFKQALATILTIPGIPVIYQGSAQAMTESRQAMFDGGFMADRDYFDQSTDLYQFIAQLAKLRTSDKLFTRGSLEIIASNKNGPGLLAYVREYEQRKVLVMFNTSQFDILVDNISVFNRANSNGAASKGATTLKMIMGDDSVIHIDEQGKLTTELKANGIVIAEVISNSDVTADNRASMSENNASTPENNTSKRIEISTPPVLNKPISKDITINGTFHLANTELMVVNNSRLELGQPIWTDENGHWTYTYPVRNLGEEKVSIVLYHQPTMSTSDSFDFITHVTQPKHTWESPDPKNDNDGISGTITPPTHNLSLGQTDITDVKAEIGGDVLRLTLTMRELTDGWIPANGFDNVAFSIFFDTTDQNGLSALPLLNASMPNEWQWNLGHVVYGWGNTTFSHNSASPEHQGLKLGVAPRVKVDKALKQIQLTYNALELGVKGWQDTNIYITTWDISGEGVYRELTPQSSKWRFGGGEHNDAKIADFVELSLINQETTVSNLAGDEYLTFLLAGQSNMDGYGKINELPEPLTHQQDVMIFHGNGVFDNQPHGGRGLWTKLQPGHGQGFKTDGLSNQYSTSFGPELTFAKTLSESLPGQKIAIIKYAVGGTGLHLNTGYGNWSPDFTEGEGKNQYDYVLNTINNAFAIKDIDGDGKQDRLVPGGIIWMQGEADAHHSLESAKAYQYNLTRLMGLLRAALRKDNTPIVIGKITDSEMGEEDIMPYIKTVHLGQQSFVEQDICAAYMQSSQTYPYGEDPWHYASQGYINMGTDFATSYLELIKRCGSDD